MEASEALTEIENICNSSNISSSIDFKFFPAAPENIPDQNSMSATENVIKSLINTSTWPSPPVIIVLISGGGSALLSLPADEIGQSEKLEVIKQMSKNGASIQQLNTVRSALSKVKGGQLLAFVPEGSTVVNLVMSDIIGDPLYLIASGPTVMPRELVPIS